MRKLPFSLSFLWLAGCNAVGSMASMSPPRPSGAIAAIPLFCLLTASCGDPVAGGNLSIDLTIEEVSPAQLPSNGGVEVTVFGHNLASGVAVTIGGASPSGVQRHSDERLTFILPPLGVGAAQVVLTNPNGQSANAGVRVYASSLAFADSTLLVQQAGIVDFRAGDLDGDGDIDLVAVESPIVYVSDGSNFPSGAKLVSYLNEGGHLVRHAETTHPGPFSDQDLPPALDSLADLDGDGNLDLIMTTCYRMATGPGEFGPVMPYPNYLYVTAKAAGDFDGVGHAQLALFSALANALTIYQVAAGGALTAERSLNVPRTSRAVARDLNGDGKDDLVFADLYGYAGEDGSVHVRYAPSFDAAAEWTTPATPSHSASNFAVADLIGSAGPDGKLDVLYFDWGNPSPGPHVHVYAGQPDGTLATTDQAIADQSLCGTGERSPLLGAVDGAVGAQCPNENQVRLLNLAPSPIGSLTYGNEVADHFTFAKIDGDSIPDLLYRTSNGIAARFSEGNPITQLPHPAATLAGTGFVSGPIVSVPGHFGGNGILAVGSTRATTTYVLRLEIFGWDGNALSGSRSFELPPTLDLDFISAMASCDFDGDGIDDLIVHSRSVLDYHGVLQVFYVRADHVESGPVLDEAIPEPAGLIPSKLQVGALRQGDRCDVIFSDLQLAYLQDASGTLSKISFIPPFGSVPADVDGDGVTDFLDGALDFHHNDGTGQLVKQPLGPALPAQLQSASDLAWVGAADGSAQLWLTGPAGTGLGVARLRRFSDGRWAAPDFATFDLTQTQDIPRPHPLRLADLNGDGLLDVAVGTSYNLGVSGNPGREFHIVTGSPDGIGPAVRVQLDDVPTTAFLWDQMAFTDYDGDGLADLYLSSQTYGPKLVYVHNESH